MPNLKKLWPQFLTFWILSYNELYEILHIKYWNINFFPQVIIFSSLCLWLRMKKKLIPSLRHATFHNSQFSFQASLKAFPSLYQDCKNNLQEGPDKKLRDWFCTFQNPLLFTHCSVVNIYIYKLNKGCPVITVISVLRVDVIWSRWPGSCKTAYNEYNCYD